MPENPSLDPLQTVTKPASPTALNDTGGYQPPGTTTPATVSGPGGEWPAVPGYAITGEIARGGMGRVLAGRERALDREVAIKVLLPGADADRFVTESKITAKLPHPNVPPVYALGTLDDGSPFLAMKLVRGRTLDGELKTNPNRMADLPRFLQVFEQIAQAVGFAHAQGIIHRDLKPANVMVGAFGEVQVMDWGLAKDEGRRMRDEESSGRIADSDSSLIPHPSSFATVAGVVMGTPAYMAPEQARGEPVDVRADVFALGGILTAILTGKAVFSGNSAIQTIQRAAAGDTAEALARLAASGADLELIALATRCLHCDPAVRPIDGLAVAKLIAAHRRSVADRLRQAEMDRAAAAARAGEQRKRLKVKRALAGTVALLLVAAAAFAWWQNEQTNRRERDGALLKQEREFKAEQARQGVASNLTLATKLRRQYRFKEADDALTQGAKLAEGAPELAPQVKQARDDLAFAVHLDDIRFRKWVWIAEAGGKGYFNTKIAAPEYRKAFAERDRDLTILPPAEAASWIAASEVKAELVAAVDDWALYEPDAAVRDRLLEVTRRADPGPWTDRLRDPASRGDREAVQKLAAEADPVGVAPAALGVLVVLMDRQKIDGRKLLTAARVAHPSEFELAFALGHFSTGGQEVGPYEAARALRPENRTVWNNLGTGLRETKDLDGAVAALQQAIVLDPKFAGAHMNLGGILHDKKDLAGAVTAFQKAVELDPKLATAHNNLGVVLHDEGNLDGAIAAYKKAIELDPNGAVAHINLGTALRDKKDADGAVAAHNRAIALDPGNPAAHHNLGNALHDKKDLDGAIAAYKKAVELDPNGAVAHFDLGLAFHDKKQIDGAVAAFRRAIELDPRNAVTHINLGLALEDKEDAAGAIAAYQKATELDPGSWAAHSSLGLMYFQQKNYAAAIASLRTAIRLNPKLASNHAVLGMSLFQLGDVDGARSAMRDAIRLDSKRWQPLLSKYLTSNELAPPPRLVTDRKDPSALITQGNVLRARGQFGEAAGVYREALGLDPKNAQAHNYLGIALYSDKDYPAAEKCYREAIRLDPAFAVAHSNLAIALRQQQKYPEALAAARAALRLNPNHAAAHATLGLSLLATGDRAGAKAALAEAARLDPKQYGKLVAVELAPAPREVKRP